MAPQTHPTVQEVEQAHLAPDVVILVQGEAVDAESHAAAAGDHVGQWGDAEPDPEVGTRVDGDRHAPCGQQELVGSRVLAVRQSEARREQADAVQVTCVGRCVSMTMLLANEWPLFASGFLKPAGPLLIVVTT